MDIKEFENRIIEGECKEVMRRMPDEFVNMVMFSPPYSL